MRRLKNSMTHHEALAVLGLAAILWSVGGLLIKWIPLHPMAIAGARSGIAVVFIAIVCRPLHFTWSKAQWGAAVGFALTVTCFVAATKLTTAANAILLQYTAPVYVAFLSVRLLGESISRRAVLALSCAALGMVLFFLENLSTQYLLGNMLAILSGVAFAAMAICMKLQKGISTTESMLLGNGLAALAGLPFLFMGSLPTVQDTSLLLILGLFQIGLPYILYSFAIRHVTALEGTLIPMIEPILNPVWVALFYGEIPSLMAILGGGVVMTSLLFYSLGPRPKPSAGTGDNFPLDKIPPVV